MQDVELDKKIFGLDSAWYFSRVELKVKEQSLDIWIEHDFGVDRECPKCSRMFTSGEFEEGNSSII